MRRIGALMGMGEDDPQGRAWFSGFTDRLAELGWIDGRNMQMDVRWVAGNVGRMEALAKELVRLQPDVILANSTPVTSALKRETLTIPIVFAVVSDPEGSGLVASLPRPGGNVTGFSHTEASLAGKWLELLTEIAPATKRAAMIFNPNTAPYVRSYFLPPFETAARFFNIVPITAPVRSDAEIETAIEALTRQMDGGLVVMPDNFNEIHRLPIITLAARNKVPAVYLTSDDVRLGGLLSYGPSLVEVFRHAADYADRILRGAKPSDLPVQLPVKFEMAVNAKTAKALGLTVPPSILVRADEVIE